MSVQILLVKTLKFTPTHTHTSLGRLIRKEETQLLSCKAEKRRDVLFQEYTSPLLWGRKYNKRKYPSSPSKGAQSPPWLLLSWVCSITATGTLSMHMFYGIQLWKQGKKKNSALRNAYQHLASDRWGPELHLVGIIPSHQCLKVTKPIFTVESCWGQAENQGSAEPDSGIKPVGILKLWENWPV